MSGEAVELGVSENGDLLIEERTISQSELPDAVKKALAASRFREVKIDRVERVAKFSKSGSPSYELVVEQRNR